jgi:hypothetical protein
MSPFEVQATTTRPKITVTDATTLTAELSGALAGARGPRPRHDPGRVLVDLAVAIADGAETISDIAVLADQSALLGPVASGSICWRLLDALDESALGRIAAARAQAREVAWAQRAEITGRAFARSRVAGSVGLDALVIDVDAHVLVCHSEKQQTAATFKHTFGYHPLLAFCDNTGEFLAAQLRPGNARSNTAADHIASSTPRSPRFPTPIGPGIRSWCPGRRCRVHEGVPRPPSQPPRHRCLPDSPRCPSRPAEPSPRHLQPDGATGSTADRTPRHATIHATPDRDQ